MVACKPAGHVPPTPTPASRLFCLGSMKPKHNITAVMCVPPVKIKTNEMNASWHVLFVWYVILYVDKGTVLDEGYNLSCAHSCLKYKSYAPSPSYQKVELSLLKFSPSFCDFLVLVTLSYDSCVRLVELFGMWNVYSRNICFNIYEKCNSAALGSRKCTVLQLSSKQWRLCNQSKIQ